MEHHPAALRNRDPILTTLKTLIPNDLTGLALEISSGTGAHIEVFAPGFPHLLWQPSEYIPEESDDTCGVVCDSENSGRGAERALGLIDRYGSKINKNVLPAVHLNAALAWEGWPKEVKEKKGQFNLVIISNVFHITPYTVTQGTLVGAAMCLREGGVLVVYGPFKVDGKCTTEGNIKFDLQLQDTNPLWGYRDIAEVKAEAAKHGLELQEVLDMPANNFLLHFKRGKLAQSS